MDFRFYNVGNGRKIRINQSGVEKIFLDCGSKFGQRTTKVGNLKENNVDVLILSHLHHDHYGLVNSFKNKAKIYWNAYGLPFSILHALVGGRGRDLKKFLALIIKYDVTVEEVYFGSEIHIDNEVLDVLFPQKGDHSKEMVEINKKLKIIANEYKALEKMIDDIIAIFYDKNEVYNNYILENIITLLEKYEDQIYLIGDEKLLNNLSRMAHDYNVVCSYKSKIYLPGDVRLSNLKKFNYKKIDFKKVEYFELPHHGSNYDEYFEEKAYFFNSENRHVIRSCDNFSYNYYKIKDFFESITLKPPGVSICIFEVYPTESVDITKKFKWKNRIICTSQLKKDQYIEIIGGKL